MRCGRSLVWVILLAALGLCARADSWRLTPGVKNTPYTFGETRVVLHYEVITNSHYPEYTLKVFRGDKLQGEHKGVGFEQVFADTENRFFLGVSNDGLMRTAWVVFDRQGRIIKEQQHNMKSINYCGMSVTLVRRWYDKDKPEAQFKVEEGKLKEVSVRGCKGQRVVLALEPEKP